MVPPDTFRRTEDPTPVSKIAFAAGWTATVRGLSSAARAGEPCIPEPRCRLATRRPSGPGDENPELRITGSGARETRERMTCHHAYCRP